MDLDPKRRIKDLLYEQVATISKAVASPKRLELIELLCQSEKTVETLAEQAQISVKLASAHLRQLKGARLVASRRDGKYVYYRLVDHTVADFWVGLRQLAEERLLELQQGLSQLAGGMRDLEPLDRHAILEKARLGEIVILDVRPEEEFQASHLPFARCMPLAELRRRLKDLPRTKPVVAYCRGPFCLMAGEAVDLLRKKGFQAQRLEDGVAEWRSRGLPLATEAQTQ